MFSAAGANRYEANARKSLSKCGLKQVEGVTRVTLKIDGQIYGMTNPDVAHLPGSDLYVVFGQPAQDGLMNRLGKNPEAMAAMSGMGAGMNPMDMMGGMDMMNFGAGADSAAAAEEEEEEEGEVDEEGLDPEEIESIIAQVGCSRAKAAKTLRRTGTLVDAVIELSSL